MRTRAALAVLVVSCGRPELPVEDSTPDADSAAVSGNPAFDYESPDSCAMCHPAQYDQWRQSMHAYAALSPVFEAMAAKNFRDTSGESGAFCNRCHTPIGTAQGEPGWYTSAERSELSNHGVSCDFCHTAVGHDGPIGNVNFLTSPGDLKYGPFADPQVDKHQAAQSDFLRSPEFCGTCHDVFMEPGLDIEEAFSEYDEYGGAGGDRCQDCHMGPEPGHKVERPTGPIAVVEGYTYPDREQSSHRFIGPDYSLLDDFPYPDDLAASAAAQEEYETQRLALLKRAVRLADVAVSTESSDAVVTVQVQSTTKGHRVPTGFTSERQLWVELKVTDANGEVIFVSGDLDEYGDLRDVHSWAVKAGSVEEDEQLVNFQSKNKLVKRTWTESGTIEPGGEQEVVETVFPFDANWIEKHSLEPGETRELSYNLGIPRGSIAGPATVEATLYYRNLPPYVLRALALDDYIPKLRIATIDQVTVKVE